MNVGARIFLILSIGLGSGFAETLMNPPGYPLPVPSADRDILTGPGIPKIQYTQEEEFTTLSIINSPESHGKALMHNGFLFVMYGKDSGRSGSGFSWYDISDPTNPLMVEDMWTDETKVMREPHGFGATTAHGGTLFAFQSIQGVSIWDFTEIDNMQLINQAVVPGIEESDYDRGAWWVFWQAPLMWVGGSLNGLYLLDAADPGDLKVLKQFAPAEVGLSKVGPIFVMGNMLYASGMDVNGYAVLDISDPENPVLLDSEDADVGYTSLFNGTYFYGIDNGLRVWDVSDPTNMTYLGNSPMTGEKGGYGSFQDGFVHMGVSDRYWKIDVSDPDSFTIAGEYASGLAGDDEDFGQVLGQFIFVGDDHGQGSSLIAHTKDPDNTPPEVNAVSPMDGAPMQATTSRVGLSFTDEIDLASVNSSTVMIIDVGTNEVLSGMYSYQMGLVNFSPEEPFKENTTYEIRVPSEGLKDWSDNLITQEFVSRFSTGDTVSMVSTGYNNIRSLYDLVPGGAVMTMNPTQWLQQNTVENANLIIRDSRGKILARFNTGNPPALSTPACSPCFLFWEKNY